MTGRTSVEEERRGAKRSEEERRGAKRSEEERRGAKVLNSTLYCSKCYPLIQIGELIFELTHMAMYMIGNQVVE